MDFVSILLIIVIILLLITIYFLFSRKNSADPLLREELRQVTSVLDAKLHETNRIIFDQLNVSNQNLQNQNTSSNELLRKINENNNRILQEVTEKLVKVEDTNKQIVGFTEQLHSLQKIFTNPKQRGLVGEFFLETILSNVLPETVYTLQYRFTNGEVVDAIITVRDKIIPIDAKFSLDSYNRIIHSTPENLSAHNKDFLNDVKKRIDETSKYVRSNEGTLDIAFMFVPSDSIYNAIIELSNDPSIPTNLITYAYSKKVVLVSPTSFFAYLQTVLLALNTIKLEGEMDNIIKYLNETGIYLKKFEENMNRLGKNLSTLINTYNKTSTSANTLSKKIGKVTNNKENLLGLQKIVDSTEENLIQ
jgi:DNA recombination protein RmuC